MSAAFWVCATVTLVSAFVSLGYSLAALARSNAADRTSSMYAAARSLALASTAVVALFARSTPYLEAVATSMVAVQAIDAAIGVAIRDRFKSVGPALTSLANLAALIWLLQD